MNPCSTTSPYRIDYTFLEECHSSKERKRIIVHTLVPRRAAGSMEITHQQPVAHARLNLGDEGCPDTCLPTATRPVHLTVVKRYVGFHRNEPQVTCVNADRRRTKSAHHVHSAHTGRSHRQYQRKGFSLNTCTNTQDISKNSEMQYRLQYCS